MTPSKPVLYFDVTDIVEYALVNTTVTGIQRCVLRILESVIRQGADRPVLGLLKHPLTGAFKEADLSFMRDPYDLSDFASRFELLSGKTRWLARKLRNYRKASLKRSFRWCALQGQWAASKGLRAQINSLSEQARPSCLRDLELVRGSAIVSLGAGWGTDYTGLGKLARSHDCKTVSFVHDIFAITAQHYTGLADKKKNARFRNWLEEIARSSDLLICNSLYTKNQLEKYLAALDIAANIAVARFPHEFKSATQIIREEIIDLSRRKYLLCVGTIEIRKNILPLLEVWTSLQKTRKSDTPVLVLAGGKGWSVGNVYDFLRRTGNAGGTVKIIDKPNDAELEFLYQNCEFTVFPSLFEGWGLPIGESLWFRKPVICADNASMPEVGRDFAAYFNHETPGSLFAALEQMIENPKSLPYDIRSYLTTWDDTASSICSAIGTALYRGGSAISDRTMSGISA
jgi:glycosyltransferase involved in cell wall biosynthesis